MAKKRKRQRVLPRSAVSAGSSLPSQGYYPIDLSGAESISNVTIRNCRVIGFDGVARIQAKKVRDVLLIDNDHRR